LTVRGRFPIVRTLSLFLFFAAPAAFSAAPVEVTEAEMLGEKGRVVLWGAVEVRDIRVARKNGRALLILPEYVSKEGRRFAQARLLREGDEEKVARALDEGRHVLEAKFPVAVAVGDPRLLSGENRLANVDVTFNDALAVTFGVMKSKRPGAPYWLAYPSRRVEGKKVHFKQVLIHDAGLKKSVEALVMRKFERALSERRP